MGTRTAPLRHKLNSIALITTGVALLLTTLMFFVGEVVAVRRSSLQELRILSEVVASNSSAALAFDNPEDAGAVLAAFRADPHIVAAALFKPDGQLFVSYPGPAAAIPTMSTEAGYRIDGTALIGVTPVREDARVLGTLYVRSDLSAVYDRVMFYTLVALLVISEAGLEFGEYSPLEVKISVVGYGRAEKHQVQLMVRSLLRAVRGNSRSDRSARPRDRRAPRRSAPRRAAGNRARASSRTPPGPRSAPPPAR